MTTPIEPSLNRYALAEIRAELGRRDMTRKELAELLGVDRMWIYYRLDGTTPLRVDDLARIADALDVPVRRFIPAAEPAPGGAR